MKKALAFCRGVMEFRSDDTWADPARSAGLTDLDLAYDWGREWAH